jgi:hypothetical protein
MKAGEDIQKGNPSDVKFCVCSFTDLLGFSSHLEIGSDLRTNIGQQAIRRLKVMEDVIGFIEAERKKYPHLYPENIFYARINDAIVLTIDLPEQLMPEIGSTRARSVSREQTKKLFKEIEGLVDDNTPKNEFYKIINDKLTPLIHDLCLFVGLVSRIHRYIEKKENIEHFPGPKTVVSTGYRKVFINNDGNEDFLSANFAFSNAYIAEGKLKGSKIFFDNHILQLLSISPFGKNLVRYGLIIMEEPLFDPAKDYDDILFLKHGEEKIAQVFEVELFRKQYLFREVNPSPLALFQLLLILTPYLKKEKTPEPQPFFTSFFTEVSKNQTFEELKDGKRPVFSWMYLDIESDIISLQDRLINVNSDYMKALAEKEKAETLTQVLSGQLSILSDDAIDKQ